MMFGGCQTNRKQVENKRYIIIFVGSRKGITFAPSSIVNEILIIYIMETTNKEVVEKEVYVHDENEKEYASKGVAGSGLGLGIAGTALGLMALWGRGNGFGFGGYNGGMPENVNINTYGGVSGANAAPTAFQAWENACDGRLALTNEMWGLKMNTMTQMYDHRQTDIAEKFSIWKSQVDADFGLYKSNRDSYDAISAKMNEAAFGLYKEQRDNYDKVSARLSALETQVAVGAAIRPYQDRLLQCEIDKAYCGSINYTDRKTCRMIQGALVLPSTPTTTGFQSITCPCNQQAAATPTT